MALWSIVGVLSIRDAASSNASTFNWKPSQITGAAAGDVVVQQTCWGNNSALTLPTGFVYEGDSGASNFRGSTSLRLSENGYVLTSTDITNDTVFTTTIATSARLHAVVMLLRGVDSTVTQGYDKCNDSTDSTAATAYTTPATTPNSGQRLIISGVNFRWTSQGNNQAVTAPAGTTLQVKSYSAAGAASVQVSCALGTLDVNAVQASGGSYGGYQWSTTNSAAFHNGFTAAMFSLQEFSQAVTASPTSSASKTVNHAATVISSSALATGRAVTHVATVISNAALAAGRIVSHTALTMAVTVLVGDFEKISNLIELGATLVVTATLSAIRVAQRSQTAAVGAVAAGSRLVQRTVVVTSDVVLTAGRTVSRVALVVASSAQAGGRRVDRTSSVSGTPTVMGERLVPRAALVAASTILAAWRLIQRTATVSAALGLSAGRLIQRAAPVVGTPVINSGRTLFHSTSVVVSTVPSAIRAVGRSALLVVTVTPTGRRLLTRATTVAATVTLRTNRTVLRQAGLSVATTLSGFLSHPVWGHISGTSGRVIRLIGRTVKRNGLGGSSRRSGNVDGGNE